MKTQSKLLLVSLPLAFALYYSLNLAIVIVVNTQHLNPVTFTFKLTPIDAMTVDRMTVDEIPVDQITNFHR